MLTFWAARRMSFPPLSPEDACPNCNEVPNPTTHWFPAQARGWDPRTRCQMAAHHAQCPRQEICTRQAAPRPPGPAHRRHITPRPPGRPRGGGRPDMGRRVGRPRHNAGARPEGAAMAMAARCTRHNCNNDSARCTRDVAQEGAPRPSACAMTTTSTPCASSVLLPERSRKDDVLSLLVPLENQGPRPAAHQWRARTQACGQAGVNRRRPPPPPTRSQPAEPRGGDRAAQRPR